MTTERDIDALKQCVELAREALKAGDAPFGSVLVAADGTVMQRDRNRDVSGENGDYKADPTLHPEFTLAKWAQRNMSPEERAKATVYTSGEHCAMCSAAHAYVGLGRIVYASSTKQYAAWRKEFGINVDNDTVRGIAINDVAPHIPTEGPVEGFDAQVKELQREFFKQR
ncbi:hypothetical protein K4F52_003871 [Lecanicillium sp. MT-2017a]|nr:hypothetical protein K4F52_003871 [Lecanicillium sp. MT-2017a]